MNVWEKTITLTRDSIEVTLTCTSSSYRNCWAQAHYTVTSPRPLLAEDIEELRSHVMSGQETGVTTKSGFDALTGSYYYHLRSICDSGD